MDPRQRGQLAERQRYSFAIADAKSNKAVGAIGLGLQHLSAGRATAGYAVSPAHRGRGIATSALQALTSFAWTIPALYRVELYIEPWNTSSIRVAEAAAYRRVGFQPVGVLRRYERGPDGGWHDGLLMDLLPEDLTDPTVEGSSE